MTCRGPHLSPWASAFSPAPVAVGKVGCCKLVRGHLPPGSCTFLQGVRGEERAPGAGRGCGSTLQGRARWGRYQEPGPEWGWLRAHPYLCCWGAASAALGWEFIHTPHVTLWGFPGGPVVESTCNAGDPGSISGSRILQYSCLGNPMDRGAWRDTVHGVTKSQTRLSNRAHKTGLWEGQGAAYPIWGGFALPRPHLLLAVFTWPLGEYGDLFPSLPSSRAEQKETSFAPAEKIRNLPAVQET